MKKYFLVLFLIGCSATDEIIDADPNVRLNKIKSLMSEENYLEALVDLKTLRLEYPANSFADTVQFLIAECYFLKNDLINATTEYEQVIINMPQSNFVSDATFKRALAYYKLSPKSSLDQKYSFSAIEGFQSFFEYKNNDSLKVNAENNISIINEKLAKKIFDNAEIYYKMNLNKAAVIYYDLLMERFPDSKYSESSLYKKILALKKRKLSEQVKRETENFISKYPQSEFVNEIKSIIKSENNNAK